MLNEIVLGAFFFIILLYSVIIHEVSHGISALWQGDTTAKYAGRLNLNPFNHIDIWGSIIVPILMYFGVGFAFGWAKPVPYNPYNLKNQKWGPALVALSGPASNLVLAVIFTVIARLIDLQGALKVEIITHAIDFSAIAPLIAGSVSAILFEICIVVIFINVLLAFFNLIPIPPLDGSKLLFALLPMKIETMAVLEQFGFVFLLMFILIFSGPLGTFLNFVLNIFLSQVV